MTHARHPVLLKSEFFYNNIVRTGNGFIYKHPEILRNLDLYGPIFCGSFFCWPIAEKLSHDRFPQTAVLVNRLGSVCNTLWKVCRCYVMLLWDSQTESLWDREACFCLEKPHVAQRKLSVCWKQSKAVCSMHSWCREPHNHWCPPKVCTTHWWHGYPFKSIDRHNECWTSSHNNFTHSLPDMSMNREAILRSILW